MWGLFVSTARNCADIIPTATYLLLQEVWVERHSVESEEKMTFEELKEEAKRQGYKLIKDTGYIKFKPCICGCDRRSLVSTINLTTGISGEFYECTNCSMRGPIGKNEKEAKRLWNEMIENLKWIVDRQPTIEVSEDCISRKWLFDKAECGFDKLGEDYDINHMLRDIKNAPSVVPKAKAGEWKLIKENVNYISSLPKREEFIANTYQCSECGNKTNDRTELPEICPWCGAKTKGWRNE